MIDKLKSLLKSRRFYAAVTGILIVISDGLGLGLSPDAINNVVMCIVAWIVGDSVTKTV
jgi:uncharacterized protein YebE (UPF0316 family)